MILSRRALLGTLATFAAGAAAADEVPALAAYETQTGGRVGVYAENLKSSKKLGWRAEERFPICSTFKASLAACVLTRVDHGDEQLDRMIAYGPADILPYAPVARQNLDKGHLSVRALCEAAVERSDNSCANLLLAAVGGPGAVTAFWRSIGDNVSRLDHKEPQLNQVEPGALHDTSSPAAMAATLQRLVLGDALSPPSRALLSTWMIDCKTGANRLRAGLPADWRIADKTGNNGADAAGDIAVAWTAAGIPIVICAYTRDGTPTPAQIDTVFAEVGRLVTDRLG